VIALAIKYTIGWRVSEEAEIDGIDSDQHGETAYDLGTSMSGGLPTSGVLAGSGSHLSEGVNA
jgi:Amt family ammonium transporter